MAANSMISPAAMYAVAPASDPVGAVGAAPAMDAGRVNVIDGTPVRVVTLAFAAAAGLFALKVAGFRFNVGVSA